MHPHKTPNSRGQMGIATGTMIVRNLTDYYDLAIVRDSDKSILFGVEQGSYAGGISISPDFAFSSIEDYKDYVKKRLVGCKSHQIVFYNNIKKAAYSFHKELFDDIEANFKSLKLKYNV